MKNLIQRTLTGAIYVFLILLGIVWSRYSFLVLFTVVLTLCLSEFYGLINKQSRTRINLFYNCLGGLILFAASYLYASGMLPHWVFFVYLIYVVVVLIVSLYEKQNDPITTLAYTFLGQVYIALPVSLLNFIVFQPSLQGEVVYSSTFIVALFVFIWVNDTGAYLVGVVFGRHRLFKRISPKKSWEGFFGGLLFTMASSLLFAHFVPSIPYYHWLMLSLLVVVFATWGDLVESLIKRTLSVKDSGQALPGHGGFLDRFDSFLLAVYAVLFYTQFI